MEALRNTNRRSNLLPLLLIVSLSANLLHSSGSSPSPLAVSVAGEEKVKLNLYFETLCPYSARFVVNYLYKIFQNGIIDITDLKLSPYGNAIMSSNGTINCQHGKMECLLNTIEACAIHAWPAVRDHFDFIYCVEALSYKGKPSEWESCFDILDLDQQPVKDCFDSGLGYELEKQYAEEVNALKPPHEYVPWVVVNGQPLYEEYEKFMSVVCKAYKGPNLPKACNNLPQPVGFPKDRANLIHPVSYKEEKDAKSAVSKILSATASWIGM